MQNTVCIQAMNLGAMAGWLVGPGQKLKLARKWPDFWKILLQKWKFHIENRQFYCDLFRYILYCTLRKVLMKNSTKITLLSHFRSDSGVKILDIFGPKF